MAYHAVDITLSITPRAGRAPHRPVLREGADRLIRARAVGGSGPLLTHLHRKCSGGHLPSSAAFCPPGWLRTRRAPGADRAALHRRRLAPAPHDQGIFQSRAVQSLSCRPLVVIRGSPYEGDRPAGKCLHDPSLRNRAGKWRSGMFKSPGCPHKTPIQNRFTMASAKGA